MTYRGQIKNGVAVLDDPAALPDGTRVRVEVEQVPGDFWTNRNVAGVAQSQGVTAMATPDDLAGDWPPDDSVDDFLAYLRGPSHRVRRRLDRRNRRAA